VDIPQIRLISDCPQSVDRNLLSLLGRICGRFADNSGPHATELRGKFWFPCFEMTR
jgi:hypothetical protein